MSTILDDIKLKRGRGKDVSLYKQIGNYFRTKIAEEKIRPGENLPAISEITEKLKVDYRSVKSALDMLEQEGLIRFMPGRNKGPIVIRTSRKKLAIKLVRWDCDSFAMEITEGIRRFTDNNDLDFKIIDASKFKERCVSRVLAELVGADGLIVLPSELGTSCHYPDALKGVWNSGLKVVFLDRMVEGIPENEIAFVSIDHRGGAYEATKHLLEAHKVPVYCVGCTKEPSSVQERFDGWSTAMRDYGYYDLPDYICEIPKPLLDSAECDFRGAMKCVNEAACRLFQTKQAEKYSIFAMSDSIALSLYALAEEKGLVVGRDIFIIGFGDYPFCKNLPIPLSSVNQNNQKIGYEGARLLHNMITGMVSELIHFIIPAELILRDSSGK